MSEPLSLPQATQILERLQAAAPATTAERLSQVMALLQHLAEENAYLNASLYEDAPRAAPPPEAPPQPRQGLSAADHQALLHGVNQVLRPPLVAIRGRAEAIQAGLLGQITPEQAEWLEAIQQNTERAFRVLDTLQHVQSLRANETPVEWRTFSAGLLLEDAYEQVRNRAAAAQHTLSIHAPDPPPLAHGDYNRALLTLNILLDNAIRYTPPGGQIRLSVDDMGTYVLFNVADSGIGLIPEDVAFIGTPFWRSDHQQLVRQHNGSGLSLYMAQQMLAQQDGELIFYGEPNVGSTFSFTLMAPQ